MRSFRQVLALEVGLGLFGALNLVPAVRVGIEQALRSIHISGPLLLSLLGLGMAAILVDTIRTGLRHPPPLDRR